ncbi:carboxymuconolactone decarboxylase family protein [uncultured Maribacter sp.]|uniref:carboxymuconolactone decarboxylase family protein n=1 Tax=uncultured Maribacter sp. TaxID=431308 RepID=UPI0030EDDBA6|tara:strand:- start:55204 stop:55791 length:588 start_codon:yes stop_codon:yes gene_type:complete
MNTAINTKISRFPIVSYEEATPEVKAIYDDTKKTLQIPFVLNWFKCQGNNATLLAGNWGKLKSTLMLGDVPNVLKQLIIYNVSKNRNCEYCAHAHGIFADSMSSMISNNENFRVTENLDSPIIPESYRKAIKIVTKAALNHAQVSDKDFEDLQEAGFDDLEIQELMAQADLVNMLNTIADVSGIKIDNELMEANA